MRNLRQFVFINLLLALFVSSAALSAFADPPGRAVRLKYISGAVSIQPGGVNDWVEGVVNRPLTTSDRVWTDKEARAELHLGSGALRMSAETSLTLTNVSDDIVQVELDQGTLNLHIRHLFGGETYEIDTPNQAFTILKAGDYRFDVDPNADTTSIAVWRGEGAANGQGPGVKIHSGHQVTFTAGTSLEHQMASAPGFDGFDDWCRVRDDREDHARSYQYVSADVVGADDLDEYGTWRTVGAYGPVWVPTVAPGWAPYHYGHWVWVEPWGWTWVDDAPWGFAPCHYGRWVNTGGYWAWAPGPVVVARPVYAPALVAWVGGEHWGVSLSFGGGGGVGWFPLGWGEPYVPSYHVSRNYFQQVNVTNTHITNITNVTNNYYVTSNNTTVVNNNTQNIHYANQNVHGAVTAVPTRAMTNSESVSKVAVAVPAGELKNAALVSAAPVAPTRTSVLGARAGAPTVAPPARVVAARPVVSHVAPPPKPVPFEAKQEALAKTPGRPLDAHAEAELRTNMARQTPPAPARGTAQPAQPAQPGKPGTLAASAPVTPAAPAAKPVIRPVVGAPQPAQPVSPPRMIPRPPQPGAPGSTSNPAPPANGTHPLTPASPESAHSSTPAPPANAARPVPRPPQVDRAPNAEGAGTARPSTPQPGEARRPEAPSNPNPPQPSHVPQPSTDSARPVPRPPQAQRTPNSEATVPIRPSAPQPSESRRPEAPSNPNPPQPSHVPQPSTDSRPVSPRLPQSEARPVAAQPAREAPRAPQPQPRPQAEPRPQAPRAPAESRPQHQEQHQAPNSQQPKHEDKPERNNSR
jgi:hypothetical protein